MKNQINKGLSFQKEDMIELNEVAQIGVNGGLLLPIGPPVWPLILLTWIIG